MKKLESLKGKLFEKELSMSKLRMVTGGITLTGCSVTGEWQTNDCSDKDEDQKPTQQSLSAL
ncbi:hypothetical protein [uncultured Chryseobacterium sp.]|uniref:hypothetical protein n=1 Tax=uncultured Chryseobacterium sp. TaxID=259322 RepID=UPI003748C424